MTGPALFLRWDELVELTGYKLARCQIDWLRKRGWRFEINSAGQPKVATAYFERRMVGALSVEQAPTGGKHNWAALKRKAD